MASPALVLSALSEHLEPVLLTKRLPTILQLAAHLSLVRQRITHDAALLESAVLGVPGVDPAEVAVLHRLSVADGDALFDLSLDMRREQLLRALVAGKTSSVEGLLERYLPAADGPDAGLPIYVRAMEAHQFARMAAVRDEVAAALAAVKAEPQIEFGPTLNELGREMMDVARGVVADAEEMVALFPGERRRESLPSLRRENPRKHAPRMTMPARGAAY